MSIARFTLAVDRRFKQEGGPTADFPRCVAFGKTAEFIERYFSAGSKLELTGRIQTGSYTNNDGVKVYTTDIVAEQVGFGERARMHLRTVVHIWSMARVPVRRTETDS